MNCQYTLCCSVISAFSVVKCILSPQRTLRPGRNTQRKALALGSLPLSYRRLDRLALGQVSLVVRGKLHPVCHDPIELPEQSYDQLTSFTQAVSASVVCSDVIGVLVLYCKVSQQWARSTTDHDPRSAHSGDLHVEHIVEEKEHF